MNHFFLLRINIYFFLPHLYYTVPFLYFCLSVLSKTMHTIFVLNCSHITQNSLCFTIQDCYHVMRLNHKKKWEVKLAYHRLPCIYHPDNWEQAHQNTGTNCLKTTVHSHHFNNTQSFLQQHIWWWLSAFSPKKHFPASHVSFCFLAQFWETSKKSPTVYSHELLHILTTAICILCPHN